MVAGRPNATFFVAYWSPCDITLVNTYRVLCFFGSGAVSPFGLDCDFTLQSSVWSLVAFGRL